VPTEEVVEMRMGQQRKSERKFFPGYVLVQMDLTDETWHLVKDVPRVLGFIGGLPIVLRQYPKRSDGYSQ
jgi:transcription antitermination protein nusG